MQIVISPAKTLNFEKESITDSFSMPDFLDDSAILIEELRFFSPDRLSSLMEMSSKLAEFNYDRFQKWNRPFTKTNAKQAILAFTGEVYEGLSAREFTDDDFSFAQDHLRTLSGLYGLLRPLDLIQPYRLEMGTKLNTARGRNLYQFWGDKITDAINASLEKEDKPVLVDLASMEYVKSINLKKLKGELVTPVFKELKGNSYKVVSFSAKRARGLMSSYIIKNKFKDVEEIKSFDEAGYEYNDSLSSERQWIFTRDN